MTIPSNVTTVTPSESTRPTAGRPLLLLIDPNKRSSGRASQIRRLERAAGECGFAVVVVDEPFRAFNELVESLEPPRVPTPAWVEQARRNAELRVAILDEFGLLTADQVAELAGSKARNRRATASRWRASERIFSVEHQGQTMYPGFQFDPSTGAPKGIVGEVLERLPAGLQFGGWQLAVWWVSPVDLLGWRRPVDLLDGDGSEELLVAAEAEARDWEAAALD